MRFLGTVLGLASSMMLVFGSVIILGGSLVCAVTINGAFAFGLILLPVWMAAWWHACEWATDL